MRNNCVGPKRPSPNRSCKLGSSSGRLTPWSLAPGSSPLLLTYPTVHPSSLSHSCLCIGQCVCYSSRRSPSLKKLDSSAPLRLQRYYGIKREVLVASTKWAIIGHRLRVANFRELRVCELPRILLPRTRVDKGKKRRAEVANNLGPLAKGWLLLSWELPFILAAGVL